MSLRIGLVLPLIPPTDVATGQEGKWFCPRDPAPDGDAQLLISARWVRGKASESISGTILGEHLCLRPTVNTSIRQTGLPTGWSRASGMLSFSSSAAVAKRPWGWFLAFLLPLPVSFAFGFGPSARHQACQSGVWLRYGSQHDCVTPSSSVNGETCPQGSTSRFTVSRGAPSYIPNIWRMMAPEVVMFSLRSRRRLLPPCGVPRGPSKQALLPQAPRCVREASSKGHTNLPTNRP